MSEFDGKALADKNGDTLRFTPTHFLDGNTVKELATEFGKKLDKTGDGKDVTVTFSQASSRGTAANDFASGSSLATLFGKMKKWFASLGALAFKDNVSDSYISGTISDSHIESASTWNNALCKDISYNTNKSWLKIGTIASNRSNVMYRGVTLSVEYRANDGHSQSGLLWISAGEHKSSGEYGNDDIVAEYSTIGRRTNTLTDDVKFYVKSLGTSSTSGVEIYAYLYNYSELSITPLNVPDESYTPAMTYFNEEPSGIKEVTYSMLLRSTYGTSKGSPTTPVYVDDKGNVQPCDNASIEVGGANSAGYAATAGDSTFASKVGSSASHPQIGGTKTPVYVDENGNIIECDSPSLWNIGFASRASKLYSQSYGASNIPVYLEDDGESWGNAKQSFRIPHTVALWHTEMNNGTVTGIGINHFTSRFLGGPSGNLIFSIKTPSTNVLQLTVDARSTSPWYGGQVWGTIKWDSQTGSNINSNIERIGNSNLSGDVVLASRNISVNNVQDIQGHALFAICTGDFLHKFVVDMEISLIKPQANSTLSYITVMSKCFEEDYLH